MTNWNNKDPSTDPTESESTSHTVTVPGLNSGFHTYKFIWEEGKITFFVDNVYQADHVTNVPSAPAHFMINHWGTNSSGWGGTATTGPDGTPRYFYVDWVKFTPQGETAANAAPKTDDVSATTNEDTAKQITPTAIRNTTTWKAANIALTSGASRCLPWCSPLWQTTQFVRFQELGTCPDSL